MSNVSGGGGAGGGAGAGGGVVAPPVNRMPSSTCMQNAFKLGIVEDRPIMMDYWLNSLEKKVVIGVKDTKEKLLVKSADEFTSPIVKIFKIETEYIIMTENSIYIVSSDIDNVRLE
jgi:hypothetical protein